MPIQNFNIYTAKGYAGDLVDSGPAISQTGVVEDATLAIGAAKRGTTVTNPRHIVVDTDGVNIFGIVRRELALEAKNKPSDGVTEFKKTESVSVLREGYIYVTVKDTDVTAGQLLYTNASGEFTGSTGVATTNVTAEEAGSVDDVIRARIDIVA